MIRTSGDMEFTPVGVIERPAPAFLPSRRAEVTVRRQDREPMRAGMQQPAHRKVTTAAMLGLHDQASPMRTWKPRKVWVARDGIFPKNGKCLSSHAPFESSLEALAHLHLAVDSRIRSYACQPHKLHYWMPSSGEGQDKHEYSPDFVALTSDWRLLIIDAKARRFATDGAWMRREPFIRATYDREFGAELLVWTEHEVASVKVV